MPFRGGRGVSLGPPDLRASIGCTLKMKGSTTPLSVNKDDPLHLEFVDALVALDGSGNFSVPFDLMMEISAFRIKNKSDKLLFG